MIDTMSTPTPPAISGFAIRSAHACPRCGRLVRVEYILRPNAVRPDKSGLAYWEWFERKTPNGLVILDRSHTPSFANPWYTMPGTACGFALLSFESGSRSAIDQYYQSILGQHGAEMDIHITDFEPTALLATPLALSAPELSGGKPLILLASGVVVRFFFANKQRLPKDMEEARPLMWTPGKDAAIAFLALIKAKTEAIRG